MYFRKEITEKDKPVVPFIYKGYRLYPIRKIDKEKYLTFLNTVHEEGNGGNYVNLDMDNHMNYIANRYDGKCNRAFFVFKDGRIVGDLFIMGLDPSIGGTAHVTTIGLLKEHQGKGIGRGLMTVAETLAKDARCRYVELSVLIDNPSVLGFYEKLGYSVYSKDSGGWSLRKDLTIVPKTNKGRTVIKNTAYYVK